MKFWAALLIFASLLISPNLLYLAGTGYTQAEGAAYLKIHPVTYISVFSVAIIFLMRRRNKANFFNDRFLLFLILWGGLLSVYCVLMGFNVSGAVVTLFTPVLFLYVAHRLNREQLGEIEPWLRFLLAMNAVVGIYELISGDTLLPRIVADVIVQTDQRSLGFVGHPLSSAALSGIVTVYLLYRTVFFGLSFGTRLLSVGELALHVVALAAFASRATIVFVFALAIIMIFLHRNKKKISGQNFWRIFVAVMIVVIVAFLAQSEFAEIAMARFLGDQYTDSSSQSRFTLLALLSSMGATEWLTGVTLARRLELQDIFDTTYGVEVTWIAWILSFGLIWTVALMISLWKLLMTISRFKGASHIFMTAFFLLVITSAQGLGGKTLLLMWFLSILLCFQGSNELVIVNLPARRKNIFYKGLM